MSLLQRRRRITRVALVVLVTTAVTALGMVALAAFNLRTFVDAHREELLARGERLLERPLEVGTIGASWWPVGIRFAGVTIGEDPRFGAAPFLDAAAVRITLHPWALALGRVEVSGVVLDGPRIHLVRDQRGRWNVASLGAAAERSPRAPSDGAKHHHGARVPLAWIVGMAGTEVHDGRVEVEDRTADPPRRLHAARVRARANDIRLGGAPHVRIDAALFAGDPDAHLDVRIAGLGENDRERTPFNARLDLHEVDLATVAAWNGAADVAGGRLASATVEMAGTLERGQLTVDARGGDAPLRLPPGWVLLSATAAATLRARVTYDRNAIVLEEAHATVGTLTLDGRGSAERVPWRGALTVQSAAASGLDLGFARPPLRLTDLALRLEMEGDVIRSERLTASLDGAPAACTATTRTVAPRAFEGRCRAEVFGGSFTADVELSPGSRRVEVRADARALDVGVVVARLAPDLAGRVAGEADGAFTIGIPADGRRVRHALSGAGRIVVHDGRLLGLNPVERLLGYGGGSRLFPHLLSARTRGRFPALLESGDTPLARASADFTLEGGRVVVEPLVAATDTYELTAVGSIEPRRRVRLHGDLVFSPALSAALREDLPMARLLSVGGGRLSVPFRIQGGIEEARLEPDVKRVRTRGLQALLERDAEPGAEPTVPRPPARAPRPRVERELPGMDRLERILRP